jgi:hypothetical protein
MWDKTDNRFFTNVDDCMICLCQQIAHDTNDSSYIPYDHVSEGSVFEQFTGLHDRNGVEIYEGDIVSDGTSTRIVIYQAPEFVLKRTLKANTWIRFICHPDSNQYQEVIGNIHQNPELL